MRKGPMQRPGLTAERLGALWLFGLVLLLTPLLGVFDKPHTVAGIPLLYLFMYVAWALLIGLVALAVARQSDDDDPVDETARGHDAPGVDK